MSGFTQLSILPYLGRSEFHARPPHLQTPRSRPRKASPQYDPTQRTLEEFEHYWYSYYETPDDLGQDSRSPTPTLDPSDEDNAPLLPADPKLRLQSAESRGMMLAHMSNPIPEYPPDQPQLELAVQAACRLSPGAAATFASCMSLHKDEASFTYDVLQKIADSCDLEGRGRLETQLRYLLFTLRISIHWKSIEFALAETVLQHSKEDMDTLTAVYHSGHAFMSSIALAWLAFNKKWVYLHLIHDIWGVGPEELFFFEPSSFEAFKRYGMEDTRDCGLWYVEQKFEEDDVAELAMDIV